jgi:hypothetical protein
METKALSILIIISLVCVEVLPEVRAVVPAPDGGYPNGNAAEGQNALFSLTSGGYNTAIGFLSLGSNTTNSFNTAVGAGALLANTADQNTAIGAGALLTSTMGYFNTATGAFALLSNDTGYDNVAIGDSALYFNTTGNDNTAIGYTALYLNTTGSYNTANGSGALSGNISGSPNSAFGWGALRANSAGNYNTAIGYAALYSNNNGNNNTALGDGALYSNTSGNYNIAIGVDAGYNMTGSDNIALGNGAGFNLTAGDDNIEIGNEGVAGDFQTIRIGTENFHFDTFIAGVDNSPVTGTPVVVNGDGQLGVAPSSERFKQDIKPMGKASETILALKPVTFRYNKQIDAERTPQFGLLAEDVEAVNPDLVVRDKEGKPYSVRYDQVNAMLLNEFLKEHKTVQELKSIVVKQEAIAAQQQKQIEALTAELQKVSAQLELNKPAPHTVLNDQ